jgi:hypothetical protein
MPQHTDSKSVALHHSEGSLVVGYIPQSVAALWKVDANTGKEASTSTSKPVVLPGLSPISVAKGRSCWGFFTGLFVHKTLLLNVVALHGSRRSETP